MNFQCPSCNITLQAEAEFAGKIVKCPGCNTRIEIPADFAQAPSDPENDRPSSEKQTKLPELNFGAPHGNHPSEVSLWVALGIGAGLTALIYFVLYLVPDTLDAKGQAVGPWIKQFFCNRGWPQHASTFLAGWCIGLLALKYFNIQKQKRAMLLQALPSQISAEINVNNLKEFHDNLLNFPKKLRNTYMVNRIRKALEFFYVRQNNPEVAQMVSSMSEVDANKVAGSYSMVKVFLWAIPIMGFIGTVLGIGQAIGGFGNILSASGGEGGTEGGVGQIVEGLTPVLGSMGMAFDTTLLALVYSIILAFPASALQGMEDNVVTNVDEYCIDNFLKRLNDGGAGKTHFEGDAELLRAVGEAMAENQKDIMSQFSGIQKDMSSNLEKQTLNHAKVSEAVEKQIAAIEDRAKKYETRLDDEYFGHISSQVKLLSEGIHNLNHVLRELNGKQIIVKKRWFG